MKTVEQWLEEYEERHQNPFNRKIHLACVPVLTFSVIGLFWAASSWLAWVFLAGFLVFYLRLSVRLATAMALIVIIMLLVIFTLETFGQTALLSTVITLFMTGGILQIWGHRIEGTHPALLKNITFLFIGPLWVLASLFRKAGIRY